MSLNRLHKAVLYS